MRHPVRAKPAHTVAVPSEPRASAPPAAHSAARLESLDALRGLAILMMVSFHACYDLNHFGYAHFRMLEDPFWTTWRTLIVSCFVGLAGASQQLSRAGSQRGFYTRTAQLAGSAALVSAVTRVLFASRWIYFGVLHFFTLAALLTRPWLSRPALLGWGGLCLLGLSFSVASPVMDARTLNWIGLAAHKPATEDYAPLLPWLGWYWLGAWFQQRFPQWSNALLRSGFPARPWLALLGRHSLLIYLLHQPLLFGLLAWSRQ